MLRLRRFVGYLFGAADVGPFFAYQEEPNTVLVWTDGDWSGNAVTRKSSVVSTTLQLTRFRCAKVCCKWLQETIDDHNIQSDYKCTIGLKVEK